MIKFLDLQQVNAPVEQQLLEAAARVIRSGRYLLGDETSQFESEYANYIGTPHCVTCGNGLDALTLMLGALIEMGRLAEGDEVIVPANTFLATVLAVTRVGLRPVLVEPSRTTLQIDPSQIPSHITSRTRAMLLVHLYGTCAYTPAIEQLCRDHRLLLLEDNAQAHGCRTSDGRRTGSLGLAAAHSFYPGKNLGAIGDAGAVTTHDAELARTVRQLGNYGFSRRYYADLQGVNSRIDDLQAAFLRVRMEVLDVFNERRSMIADVYHRSITNPLIRLVRPESSVYHLFPVFCAQRDRLQQHLADCGIETLIHYPVPPHRQECYPEFHHLSLPITEELSSQELSLPLYPMFYPSDAEKVAQAVNEFRG